MALYTSTSHPQVEPEEFALVLPGKQARGAARGGGGGTQGWKTDYMSLCISHAGNFPHLPREERINCNLEEKPMAKITLKRKEVGSLFPAVSLSECHRRVRFAYL